jgi:hypothetical protein
LPELKLQAIEDEDGGPEGHELKTRAGVNF